MASGGGDLAYCTRHVARGDILTDNVGGRWLAVGAPQYVTRFRFEESGALGGMYRELAVPVLPEEADGEYVDIEYRAVDEFRYGRREPVAA